MSKLYVFAIGGTGARVLRALTMLLGAGVKTQASEVVPIIIDPDAACGDKTDTVSLMNQYAEIYSTQSHHPDRKIDSFGVKLTKLNFPNEYVMPMGKNTNTPFGSYMNFGALSDSNKALMNMLFSKENRETDMTIGFTGNPNIGSVVLNQFAQSPEFREFANSFQPGDKIFIISSIFGGTGASGFPLLLKNLRNIDPTINTPNAAAIQAAEIGAITVLPYFNIASKKGGVIDSDTFVSKTKAALSYYEHNLTGLDVLYYIGDDIRGQQDYNDGGPGQKNKAHFVEFAAALATLDFANNNLVNPNANNNIRTTYYKEFGIQQDVTEITFPVLSMPTYLQVARPLTEFTLFSKYLDEYIQKSLTQGWVTPYVNTVIGGQFYNTLNQFANSFLSWEKDMEHHSHARKFSPFVLAPRPTQVFNLAKGIPTTKVFGVAASNWDLLNHYLNKPSTSEDANHHAQTNEGKFTSHLLLGTRKVVSKKIKF